ncbi:hypothetical protein DNTS_029364 [Danionella cerebrum]|uniref:Uncharacterized protein n=1 Tax=Danionella cerebrum TaxID=2873325 RepID=A0A553Q7X4_9TELE|nr:hypothetical protein DNTS_029364 [Danionella translucida]
MTSGGPLRAVFERALHGGDRGFVGEQADECERHDGGNVDVSEPLALRQPEFQPVTGDPLAPTDIWKMLKTHRFQQSLALVMLMMALAAVHAQDNQSRRAVTEHQLLHDRGRSIQSLKRLIWLSSAIEGLHTAQSRALDSTAEAENSWLSPAAALLDSPASRDEFRAGQRRAIATMLSDFYRPQLSAALGLADGD